MPIETMIVVGTVVSILGTGLLAYSNVMNLKRQAERSRAAAEKSDELAQKSDELARKSDEIARLNKEIVEITKDASGAITGGDSFIYLQTTSIDDNEVIFEVVSEGKHPVYDISMQITDQNLAAAVFAEFEAKNKGKPFRAINEVLGAHAFDATVRRLALGNVPPNTGIPGLAELRWPMAGLKDRGFLIQTTARNGYMVQVMRFTKVGDTWNAATRVTKTDGKGNAPVVRESFTPNFPWRLPDGSVDWSGKGLPPLGWPHRH